MIYSGTSRVQFTLRSLIMLFLTITASIATYAEEQSFVAKRAPTRYGSAQTAGRFLYTGTVPKILDPQDLEIYVSKTMLTVRAKAWISNQQVLTYPAELILYWSALKDAFSRPNMSFVPLINMAKLAAEQKNPVTQAEFQLVSDYYSKNNLESQGINIYDHHDLKAYTNNILLALLRNYTLNPSATLQDGIHLVELAKANQHAALNQLMPALLQRQLQENLTSTNERPDHIGYLTFVYPIAATTSGPFSIEFPGIYHLGVFEGDEARWHSYKWNDEFGGFPFMQYTDYGIAFHGPITQFAVPSIDGESGTFNFWYLRRGYVSHGCHRMDPNDLLELRNLLPARILHGTDAHTTEPLVTRTVRLVTKVYPDSDLMDGKQIVFNVDYYTPTIELTKNETIRQAVLRNAPANQRIDFLKSKIVALRADPQTGRKEVKIQNLHVDPILFDGITPMTVNNDGIVAQPVVNSVELKNYAYRGVRIIQYEEAGVRYKDSSTNDDFGTFPPSYFSQRRYLKTSQP